MAVGWGFKLIRAFEILTRIACAYRLRSLKMYVLLK